MDPAESLTQPTGVARAAFTFSDAPRLTTALRRSDESAFRWLHGEWRGRINRYCFALAAGDENFAAEIAQATWLRLVRHIRVLHDEAALWNWIACAARHAAVDLRRTGGRYRRALSRFAEWWQPTTNATEGDRSLHGALEAALARMSADERSLIEDRYFTRRSLGVMAGERALTMRAIEGRLARLRTRLREMIAEELRKMPL